MLDDISTLTPGAPGSASASGQAKNVTDQINENNGFKPFGDDGFTFFDLIDVINPLQHIPVVSTLYRELTNDTIDPAARVAGGTLFGGPIGAGFALANVLIEHETGNDVGEHILNALGDDGDGGPRDAIADKAIPLENNLSLADQSWQTQVIAGFRAANTEADGAGKDKDNDRKLNDSASSPALIAKHSEPGITDNWFGPVLLAFTEAGQNADQALAETGTNSQAKAELGRAKTGARSYGENVIAAEGGWFTEAMLGALQKYEAAAQLAEQKSSSAPKTAVLVR